MTSPALVRTPPLSPWAITESGLQAVLQRAEQGVDPAAIATKEGQRESAGFLTTRNGVATLRVVGPMYRHADFWTDLFGEATYEQLALDLQSAVDNPRVHTILLAIDSPGGEVTGLVELAGLVRAADQVKPVVAYVEGLGASAAYWLASAARQIVALDTALLGSIGVRTTIVDPKGLFEKHGIKIYEIVSSQSPAKVSDPGTSEGHGRILRVLDDLAAVFIREVAANRGITEETVLADFGQGDVLIAQAAIDAGMADRLGTYEALHAELEVRGNAPPARSARASAPSQEITMTTTAEPAAAAEPSAAPLNPAPPAAEAPPTAAELAAAFPEQAGLIRTEAATAERERILGIQAHAEAGHEALIAACVADPACTPDAAAARVLAASRAARGAHLTRLADAERALQVPPAQPHADNGESTARDTARGIVALHETVSKGVSR